jgi:hypothetical protein
MLMVDRVICKGKFGGKLVEILKKFEEKWKIEHVVNNTTFESLHSKPPKDYRDLQIKTSSNAIKLNLHELCLPFAEKKPPK